MERFNTDLMTKYRVYCLSREMSVQELSGLYGYSESKVRITINEGKKLEDIRGDTCAECSKKAILFPFKKRKICDSCMNADHDPPALYKHFRRQHNHMEHPQSF